MANHLIPITTGLDDSSNQNKKDKGQQLIYNYVVNDFGD